MPNPLPNLLHPDHDEIAHGVFSGSKVLRKAVHMSRGHSGCFDRELLRVLEACEEVGCTDARMAVYARTFPKVTADLTAKRAAGEGVRSVAALTTTIARREAATMIREMRALGGYVKADSRTGVPLKVHDALACDFLSAVFVGMLWFAGNPFRVANNWPYEQWVSITRCTHCEHRGLDVRAAVQLVLSVIKATVGAAWARTYLTTMGARTPGGGDEAMAAGERNEAMSTDLSAESQAVLYHYLLEVYSEVRATGLDSVGAARAAIAVLAQKRGLAVPRLSPTKIKKIAADLESEWTWRAGRHDG